MKAKSRVFCITLAAVAAGVMDLLLSAPSAAADSIAVPVAANVIGACKFSTPQSPSVVIANSGVDIDPSIAGSATGSANINYKCTNGTTPTFGLTGGATATLTCTTAGTCGATTMDATMSLSPASPAAGQGFAAGDQVITLTGTIADTIYGPALVGTYVGSKTVTVSP